MTTFALIVGDVVQAVSLHGPKPDGYTSVPSDVRFGWIRAEDGTFSPPPPPPPSDEMIEAEHDRRLVAGASFAISGIGDVPVSGADRVQQDLTSTATAAQLAPTMSFRFRDRDGVVHNMSAAQVLELFGKGIAWVQALREAMWTLLAADPRPADYADDKHWPTDD